MNKIAIRIYLVVAVLAVTYGLTRAIGVTMAPPTAELPPWKLSELPLQFEGWQGEVAETDPEIFVASDANSIVDRRYFDEENHEMLSHIATFPDAERGIYHNPFICYRSHGWTLVRSSQEDLPLSKTEKIPVNVVVWEKDNKKVMVLYWYQLGNRILRERWDLGKARFSMRGFETWPVLMKAMIQTDFSDRGDSEERLLDFSKKLAQWMNNPEHRKYLDRWGT